MITAQLAARVRKAGETPKQATYQGQICKTQTHGLQH